jgi:hypothetical protein
VDPDPSPDPTIPVPTAGQRRSPAPAQEAATGVIVFVIIIGHLLRDRRGTRARAENRLDQRTKAAQPNYLGALPASDDPER